MKDAKYVAMDVHQATISAAVRDSSGNLVMEATIETKAETILAFVHGLRLTRHCGIWFAPENRPRRINFEHGIG